MLTILLVEDDEDDIEFTQWALEKSSWKDYSLIIVRDGKAAVDLIFNRTGDNESTPDLVLLDINLPKLDGFAVLSKIRDKFDSEELPVFIFVGSELDIKYYNDRYQGTNDYIIKPLSTRTAEHIYKIISKGIN